MIAAAAPISPADRARALLLLREIERGPQIVGDKFGEWIAAARPEFRWDYPHFRAMQQKLDLVTKGEILRVYFSIPIRHGKTEHNTIAYAAYRLERDPTTRILIGSYNQRRANKFSRQIKRMYESRGGQVSPALSGAEEWETTQGGGVLAVGAGAGVASVNADLIIIDDPIGSRDDAESPARRDQVWDWLTSDILARCEPHTAVILTMSRWHSDDPAGRLMATQGSRWTVVDLPARAEEDDPLGRAVGEPLWPEVRGDQWLEDKLAELLPYGFASLLQGRPRPRDGGMIKWAWWQRIPEAPKSGRMVRYWDLAGTRKKADKRTHDPDYTAGALLCRMDNDQTAIADVTRFRLSVHERDEKLLEVARLDLMRYKGRVTWWIETEAGIMGEERTALLVRRLQAVGLTVYTEHPSGSKVSRAEPIASAAQAGNLVLCPGEWNEAWMSEAADFPTGSHDDQVDAVSGAYAKLNLGPKPFKLYTRM